MKTHYSSLKNNFDITWVLGYSQPAKTRRPLCATAANNIVNCGEGGTVKVHNPVGLC